MYETQVLGEEQISGGQIAFGEGLPLCSGIHGQLQRLEEGRDTEGNDGEDIVAAEEGTAFGHDGAIVLSRSRAASAAGEPSNASRTLMPAPMAAWRHGSSGTTPAISMARPRKCEHAPIKNSHASSATAAPLRFVT